MGPEVTPNTAAVDGQGDAGDRGGRTRPPPVGHVETVDDKQLTRAGDNTDRRHGRSTSVFSRRVITQPRASGAGLDYLRPQC